MKKIQIKPLKYYNQEYLSLISRMQTGLDKEIIEENEKQILELFKKYYDNINVLEKFGSSELVSDDLKKALVRKFDNSDEFKHNIRCLFKLNKCPYCGINSLDEAIPIEHYLPKSKFQEFTLLGLNLFLCCGPCNSTYKGSKWTEGKRLFLNPYIDDLYNKEFIKLEIIIDDNQFVIQTSINENCMLSPEEIELLVNHFNLFNLSERLNKHLNVKITNIIDSIKRLNAMPNFIDKIQEQYENFEFEYGINSISTVLYKYLVSNPEILNKLLKYENSI